MHGRTWVLFALVLFGLASSAACAQILGFDKGYQETGGSSASSGTTSGTGGMAGTGGGGPPVACKAVGDCPGQDTECGKRTCTSGFCGAIYTAAGTAISAQTTGSCKKIVCDGHGNLDLQIDDSNIPDDSNPCTKDLCTNGVPSNPPEGSGISCGGALTCDGAGHCAGCTGPADCPGKDNECQTRSCTQSLCGFLYTAAGTPVTMQTPGDCKKNVCNGMGAVSIVFDPTDIQHSNKPCIIDGCSMGSPTQSNTAAGAACSQGTGTVCDGNGACVQCLVATSCPGQDTECQTRTCTADACGFAYQMNGMAVSTQTPGDCKKNVCNGMGAVTSVPDNGDIPDDGNVCTTDSCNNGTPVHTPVTAGTSCGAMKSCNATGGCVGCMTGADCPGQDTACQTRSCSGGGVCGFNYVANGTAIAMQTAGDCKKNVCNGAGGVASIVDDTDVPVDGNPCTSDVCSSGVPSNPPAPAGTACTVGGTVCNGAGACGVCVPGTSKFCCGPKTIACCMARQGGPVALWCDPKVQTCGPQESPGGSNLACCCDTSQDCDASGHWGGCY